ncbi:hypothetical protein SRHO_G00112820 [Serrasalmus rhombeus]
MHSRCFEEAHSILVQSSVTFQLLNGQPTLFATSQRNGAFSYWPYSTTSFPKHSSCDGAGMSSAQRRFSAWVRAVALFSSSGGGLGKTILFSRKQQASLVTTSTACWCFAGASGLMTRITGVAIFSSKPTTIAAFWKKYSDSQQC